MSAERAAASPPRASATWRAALIPSALVGLILGGAYLLADDPPWGSVAALVGCTTGVTWVCLSGWEQIRAGTAPSPALGPGLRWAMVALLVPSAAAMITGHAALAVCFAALSAGALVDHALGTGLVRSPRALVYLAACSALAGVLLATPLGTPPWLPGAPEARAAGRATTLVGHFVCALALLLFATSVYQRLRGRQPELSWPARLIRARFGGYRHVTSRPDPALPTHAAKAPRVAVIGGGLAGLSVAELLGRRGFRVRLLERSPHLGGKVGAWTETAPDGTTLSVEHGFHAFFRHYYNLNDWLGHLGVLPGLRPVSDYLILGSDGRRYSFAGVNRTPVLNLISLGLSGLYRFRDVLRERTSSRLELLLRYDPETTPEQDEVPFSRFAEDASLPPALRLVFTTFARAFFADEDRISLASLIQSFHFYYLSHDHGLIFDHVADGYEADLLAPIRGALQAAGVDVRTGVEVGAIRRDGSGFVVDGEPFDYVVLATDVGAAARMIAASPEMQAASPELSRRMAGTRTGQRYAVLRLWLDRPLAEDLPVFVQTERTRLLDALAFVDRVDAGPREWAQSHAGAVLEAHCYALPDAFPEGEIAGTLEAEIATHLPELGAVVHRHLQVRDDFTAFHVGQAVNRPGVETGVAGLYLAGDWVRLDQPAMLMEAAHTSARVAANAICAAEGVQGYPIWSVPPRGILADLPKRPGSG